MKTKAYGHVSPQTEAIINELRAGPQFNYNLTDISLRYGARIHEARQAGYKIVTTAVTQGVAEYRLEE